MVKLVTSASDVTYLRRNRLNNLLKMFVDLGPASLLRMETFTYFS